jgi:hypothetical protein
MAAYINEHRPSEMQKSKELTQNLEPHLQVPHGDLSLVLVDCRSNSSCMDLSR